MGTEVIEKLIEQYGDEIYRFCRRLTQNRADAEDLYQDTFVTAMQMTERLAGGDSADSVRKNRNFLMGIAANHWKNRSRRRKREGNPVSVEFMEENGVSPSSGQNVEEELERKMMCERLAEHIGQMPDKLKVVVCMYYTVQMKTRDIAAALHIPHGTVKNRLYQARLYLKKKMEAEGFEIYF